MSKYEVNAAGVRKAQRLIGEGKVDASTDWGEAQPSSDEENDFIDANGHDAFGEWHLAIDPDANEETKARYAFPFGDFSKVVRDGLLSAKQRAAQYDHGEVADAAEDLLERLPAGDR